MSDLKDKVVIVTGSSSGIGAETAVKFAEHGAKVVITGKNQSGINETVDRCKQAGATDQQILTVTGDLTSSDVIRQIVDEAVRTFGDIHVLVNNAGYVTWTNFEASTAEDVLFSFNNNLMTAFNLIKQALPHLTKTKGCVVNVSSISGTRVMPAVFGYSLSKAAMDHMTKILAVELAPKGVRVNSVNPGHVATPLFTRPDRGRVGPDEADQFYEKTGGLNLMGRVGQPGEVSSAILFLASDQSSFTTGELMHVDGGRHVTMYGNLYD